MSETSLLSNPLKQVLSVGQSLWYDGLVSVEQFKQMMHEDGIRGATTNPAIFEKALSQGDFDKKIASYSSTDSSEKIYQRLAIQSVREIADVFFPVYEETDHEDGYVSIEVSPLLAYQPEATLEEARELYSAIGRKNIMIKIPATKDGLTAIRLLISEGISVNATLIFSVERYQEVMQAYLEGIESLATQGAKRSGVASVASFFVSRLDSVIDELLMKWIHTSKDMTQRRELSALVGKAAIANSKRAYLEFKKFFSGPRFQKLNGFARVQRPLWASTGTKNPKYSDVLYVEELLGANTVNTVPPLTLAAFRNHGVVENRLGKNGEESLQILRRLEAIGINMHEITDNLEIAGVQAFEQSYKKIIEGIHRKRKS